MFQDISSFKINKTLLGINSFFKKINTQTADVKYFCRVKIKFCAKICREKLKVVLN